MLKTKLRTFIVLTALVAMTLGLAGCRKQDKTPPTTPPAAQQKAPNQQSLPLAGESKSPLPTPNAATSPIKK
ncbi:MAG: hypothetical protein NT169_13640 [Chloroflexi bacterium]|nr:hypothetical protein [Chloroflexota bacterium]